MSSHEWWQNPDWNGPYQSFNWINKVPDAIRELWDTFTPEQQKQLAIHFQDLVESGDGSMD